MGTKYNHWTSQLSDHLWCFVAVLLKFRDSQARVITVDNEFDDIHVKL
jgi:hypothetical protein